MKELTLYDHTGKDQYVPFTISLPEEIQLCCVHTETRDGLPYKEYIGFCRVLPNIYYTSKDDHLHIMRLGQYVFCIFEGLLKDEISAIDQKEVILPEPIYLMREYSQETWAERKCYRFDGFNRFHLFGAEAVTIYDDVSKMNQYQLMDSILPFSKYAYSSFEDITKKEFDIQVKTVLKALKV